MVRLESSCLGEYLFTACFIKRDGKSERHHAFSCVRVMEERRIESNESAEPGCHTYRVLNSNHLSYIIHDLSLPLSTSPPHPPLSYVGHCILRANSTAPFFAFFQIRGALENWDGGAFKPSKYTYIHGRGRVLLSRVHDYRLRRRATLTSLLCLRESSLGSFFPSLVFPLHILGNW